MNKILYLMLGLIAFCLSSHALALANPAAVKCVSDKLEYVVLKDAQNNQVGICIFKDASRGDSYCDEWAYYRRQCRKNQFSWPKKTMNPKDLSNYCVKRGKLSFRVMICKPH